MKKSVLAVLAALSLAACGGGEKKAEQPQAGSAPAANAEAAATDTLNIYNWSNYVDESTVEDFKKANKLKLTYDLYENNETLEAKMLTGKSGYDLVVPGIAFLPRQIEAGAYQKINKEKIAISRDFFIIFHLQIERSDSTILLRRRPFRHFYQKPFRSLVCQR